MKHQPKVRRKLRQSRYKHAQLLMPVEKTGDRIGRPLCLSNYLIHSLTLNEIPMSSAIF